MNKPDKLEPQVFNTKSSIRSAVTILPRYGEGPFNPVS